jgi:hypothetical protein
MLQANKKPRSAKRFKFSQTAQFSQGNELGEAQITNISASGIQFETQFPIKLNSKIKLLWTDEKNGIIGPTMFVVREIRKPEQKVFQYVYGAQYHQLEEDLKPKLIDLLRTLREKESQEAFEKMQEASPEYLMDIVEQGTLFLKVSLHEKAPPLPALLKAMEFLAIYEKKSFETDTETTKTIQRFATATFQCRVLAFLAPIIQRQPDLRKRYLGCVTNVITFIRETDKNFLPTAIKAVANKLISESQNRTFYAKQELLQIACETFETYNPSEDIQNELKVITSEYEESLEITKGSSFDSEAQDSIKKDLLRKASQDEIIIDNRPRPSPERDSYLILALLLIALSLAVMFIFRD